MSSLHRWVKAYSSVDINNDNTSNIFRGSGNYSSDELKELARLKKENRDLKDALEILKKAMNILKRDFNPKGPDAAWCTDITYIWTYTEGFVYLTSIMDLYSRKIIAWVLTKDMTAQSVLEVIKTAKQRRNIQQPLVIHSDRGIQFTSEEYRELTEKMKR
ncbi:DDE-type integrase/transposase/recombinase, partial [Thomasclavelia cocleata]|uniref:DDE-type integrase/transposase/recombinase n=1 Tax=Thomasclavelia cocleata TaxID=69824 RepID=UPI0024306A31